MNLRDAADPEGADSGNIGYGESVTSYAFVVRQLAIEPSHLFLGVASADVTVGRDLLNAPIPHLYEGAVSGIDAQEWRFRMNFLKIPADRCGFGETGTILKLQHRHAGERVLGDEIGRVILLGVNIDIDGLTSIPFSIT
jgi:hypothetical protein